MKKQLRFLGVLSVLLIFTACSFTAFAKVPLTGTLTAEVLSYKYWNANLSYEERVADLLSHMTLAEKCAQFLSHGSPAIPRLGIAEYWWPGEANHGIGNIALWYGAQVTDPVSTVFPNTLSQGSTWNSELIKSMASIVGDEARAYYQESRKGLSHWAPTINIGRDPRWGRADEYFAEDPFLVAQMGGAFVNGFQYDDSSKYLKAIATIKHFAANSTENDRYYSSSDVDERDFFEFYGNQFEQIIKNENPAGIMPSYNAVNDMPCAANKTLLADIGRFRYGFKGFYISDNGAIQNLYNYTQENTTGDKYWKSYHCYSKEQQVSDPMKAGINLELRQANGRDNVWQNYAQSAYNQGLISGDDIDKALFNLFLVRFKTGEFDRNSSPYSNIPSIEQQVYADLDHRNAAIAVAEQSVVLLENNGILPLKAADISSLVIVGQNTDRVYYGPYASTQTTKKKTIEISSYDAIAAKYRAANPSGAVEYISPSTDTNGNLTLSAEQSAKIQAAGTVILFLNTWSSSFGVGGTGSDFGEGKDRTTLDLPRGQSVLAEQVAALNAKTVAYMMTGAQMNVSSFNKKVAALLWCCYNGQGQGPAAANLLFGDANPSGRLTMTWYANETQLGDFYLNYGIRPSTSGNGMGKTYMYFTGDVTYPFGYGKSYSTFTLGTVSLSKTVNVTGDDTINATVTVRNTSAVDGYQVVQLYVVSPTGYTERPAKRLAGFDKVWVPAGETKTVTIPVKVANLHYWDAANNCWKNDLGTYTVQVGDSSASIKSTATFSLIKGQTLAVGLVTPTPSGYVITTKGGQITTSLNIALNNDYLYSNVTGSGLTVPGAKRTYSDGTNARITYSTSNAAVARVDRNGVVTAVKNGVATITATVTMDGAVTKGSYPVAVSF